MASGDSRSPDPARDHPRGRLAPAAAEQRGSGFGPQVSWLFAEVRAVVVALVMTAGIGFVLAGVAYGMHLDLWAVPAIVAVVASMALIVATFTPWWGLAIVINAIALYAAWQSVRGD